MWRGFFVRKPGLANRLCGAYQGAVNLYYPDSLSTAGSSPFLIPGAGIIVVDGGCCGLSSGMSPESAKVPLNFVLESLRLLS